MKIHTKARKVTSSWAHCNILVDLSLIFHFIETTGMRLEGLTAIHPYTKEHIPVWVSEYVLMDYGEGAVMVYS